MQQPLSACLDRRAELALFVGIEDTCVYPRPRDRFAPLDEHVLTGHDKAWRSDVDRIVALGADGLRYGMSWPTVHRAPGVFDWSRLDPVLEYMADQDLHVMADLVHYGCPPWLAGSFVDNGFVDALTEFAVALTDRFGNAIGSITPINEPLTTASFCGQRSVWPPALGSDAGWAEVTVALAEGSQSVIRHVRAAYPELPIVHVEASHLFETVDPALQEHAVELDMLGDLATDLLVGLCTPDSPGWGWLSSRGVPEQRLAQLLAGAAQPDLIGVNYYPDLTPRVLQRNEDGIQQLAVNRWATGLHRVVRHAAARYDLPIFVTETSIEGTPTRRAEWLAAAADELGILRDIGIDVRGLTWWPLIDFVDWSYIAEGASVEEFVTGTVDPETRRLRATPIPQRHRSGGLPAFVRHMGLLELADDGAGRTPCAAATQFEALSTSDTKRISERTSTSPHLRRSDAAFELGAGWTLDGPDGPRAIDVPKLWEALGYVDQDGTQRYATTFDLDDIDGHWTLRFDAVMDEARVELNGVLVATSTLPYTPFEIDVTGLVGHTNTLIVDVTDPPAGSPGHLGSAHGKQGWANQDFPSPPSMYLTYGGIWQPVTLRRHGWVTLRDLACNLDPESLTVTLVVEVLGRPDIDLHDTVHMDITVDVGHQCRTAVLAVSTSGGVYETEIDFGTVDLPRWSPEAPHLHPCTGAISVSGRELDRATIDIGLRTVSVDNGLLSVNGVPTPMRSVLVQGFHATALYAEGTDDEIEHEIRSAQALGFNMLRLHLRPFDPRYLRACDRLGMLLHCDMSIAEPIEHDQLDDIGPVARRCAAAVRAHMTRDRSHPSIVLWSAMNEIGNDRLDLRPTARYERFVRHIVGLARELDPYRPIIENDWIEPDLERVFEAPLATAHWYGHLDRRYLDTLAARCASVADSPVPVAVTELGDWGLPDPSTGDGRFYSHRRAYDAMLAESWWPSSLTEFSESTQHYQAVADRLQIDTIRCTGTTAGYCVTELTDVPWEFNGLLDIRRDVKQPALQHVAAANQPVAAILAVDDFGSSPQHPVRFRAWIVNDTETTVDVDVYVSVDDAQVELGRHQVSAHSSQLVGVNSLTVTGQPGLCEIAIVATEVATGRNWTGQYPLVHYAAARDTRAQLAVADPAAQDVADAMHYDIVETAPILLVGEESIGGIGNALHDHLARGHVAVVMAQTAADLAAYPGAAALVHVRTEWGGTPFRYTTDTPGIRSFPPRTVLHIHDADIAPDTLVRPDAAVRYACVGVLKPPPRPASGLVLGAIAAGGGTIVVSQYRLHDPLLQGSATAHALLADVIDLAKAFVPNHTADSDLTSATS